jgi:hypothetical protein
MRIDNNSAGYRPPPKVRLSNSARPITSAFTPNESNHGMVSAHSGNSAKNRDKSNHSSVRQKVHKPHKLFRAAHTLITRGSL